MSISSCKIKHCTVNGHKPIYVLILGHVTHPDPSLLILLFLSKTQETSQVFQARICCQSFKSTK